MKLRSLLLNTHSGWNRNNSTTFQSTKNLLYYKIITLHKHTGKYLGLTDSPHAELKDLFSRYMNMLNMDE